MRIYLASSWRNTEQPEVVNILRVEGHEVYDFRNPPNGPGFAWGELDRDWLDWRPEEYIEKLESHPRAQEGFKSDHEALDWCDTCVLLLPCGRSAHLELGYAVGQGKRTAILIRPEAFEPELMYLLCDFRTTLVYDLLTWLRP